MNKEVCFKGVCPVEFFKDLYDLSKKDILKIEDFTFCEDHIDAVYYDMWYGDQYVRIDEFDIWFRMCINEDAEKMVMYIGASDGQYRIYLDITDDTLSFYNKWLLFKEDNPKYEDFKIVPLPEPPSEEETKKIMEIIKCETCLFTDHCDRLFCLRE